MPLIFLTATNRTMSTIIKTASEQYIWNDPGTSFFSMFNEYRLPESSPKTREFPYMTGEDVMAELNSTVPGLYVNSF